jgi:hypothetical protein
VLAAQRGSTIPAAWVYELHLCWSTCTRSTTVCTDKGQFVVQCMPRAGIATVNRGRGEGHTLRRWAAAACLADEVSLQAGTRISGTCMLK